MKIRNLFLKSLLLGVLGMLAIVVAPSYSADIPVTGTSTFPLVFSATSEDKVTINMASYGHTNSNNTATSNAGIIEIVSWKINNGYTQSGAGHYTFNGTIIGSGDIDYISWDTSSHNSYTFTGDMSAYSGDIIAGNSQGKSGSLQLNFTGDARSTVSGTGSINLSLTDVTYNLGSGASSINNESITAVGVNFNSASDSGTVYHVNSDITAGDLTVESSVAVNVSAGHTVTVNSVSTIAGSLSFASGSTLDVAAGTSIESLTMERGSTLVLDVEVGETSLTLGAFDLTGDTGQLNIVLNSGVGFSTGDSFTLFEGLDLSAYDTSLFNVTLNGSAAAGEFSFDASGNLIYSIAEGKSILTWAGPSGSTWSTDSAATLWNDGGAASAFKLGDDVIFDDTAPGMVSIDSVVTPGDMVVNNSIGNDYTFTGSGEIAGLATLTKSGEGTLTITGMTNTFSGGVELNGGIISVDGAAALGTGMVTFGGGTLDLQNMVTTLDFSKLAATGDHVIRLNLNESTVTAQNAASGSTAGLSVTGTGILNFDGWGQIDATKGLHVGSGVTVRLTQTNAGSETVKSIFGEGTLIINNTNVLKLRMRQGSSVAGEGFTGTLKLDGQNVAATMVLANTNANNRMALDFTTRSSGVSSLLLISVAGSDNTLYLDSLSGNGYFRFDAHMANEESMRSVDLQMSQDNDFGGYFSNHNGRQGNFIVSSTSGDNFELTLSGTGYGSNSSSTTQKQLQVQNATVRLTGSAATWNGVIDLQQSESELIFDHSGVFTRTSGAGEITGDGVVRIASTHGVALNGANSHTGGTRVMENAALDLGHNSAAGTGTLYLENAAKVRLADGLSVNNLIDVSGIATISTLNDGGTATLTGTIVNATADASNKLVIGNGTEASNITFSGRANDANIEVASTSSLLLSGATLNAATILSGSGAITYKSVAVDGVTASAQTTLDSFLTAQGTTVTDVLQFTLTGLHVEAVESTTDSLTLNVTLTESELADFTEAYKTNSEIVVFELAGIDALTAEYNDILINIVGTEYSSAALGLVYDDETGNALLYIPEPSTVTLSMLALAGLLARRRRQVA